MAIEPEPDLGRSGPCGLLHPHPEIEHRDRSRAEVSSKTNTTRAPVPGVAAAAGDSPRPPKCLEEADQVASRREVMPTDSIS